MKEAKELIDDYLQRMMLYRASLFELLRKEIKNVKPLDFKVEVMLAKKLQIDLLNEIEACDKCIARIILAEREYQIFILEHEGKINNDKLIQTVEEWIGVSKKVKVVS